MRTTASLRGRPSFLLALDFLFPRNDAIGSTIAWRRPALKYYIRYYQFRQLFGSVVSRAALAADRHLALFREVPLRELQEGRPVRAGRVAATVLTQGHLPL